MLQHGMIGVASFILILVLLIDRGGLVQILRLDYQLGIRVPCCVVGIPHNSWVLVIIKHKVLTHR